MSTTLAVDGMHCENCEATVTEALSGVEGVESASADHENGVVAVEGDADELDLIVAVQDAGYEVEG